MHVVAITGGGGFVGVRLAASLLDEASTLGLTQVRLLDVRPPRRSAIPPAANGCGADRYRVDGEKLKFITCDITDKQQLMQALNGVDTVFHLASYGMSGREMLNEDRIQRVNVGGTRNIIDACHALSIPRLLYVSTYNVVFGQHPIVCGSEDTIPYASPKELEHDAYSRSKRRAEEDVIQANSKTLSTCAIRPAAIYGDGEERHLNRILSTVRSGLALAAIGSPDVLCDWVYIDNLTQALILAASSLSHLGPLSPAAGSAYCISDDQPINTFDFLRPLCAGLGYRRVFLFYIPFILMFYLSWLLEIVHAIILRLTCRLIHFQPWLTRGEVCKVGVTHWFSMEKAKKELGYSPRVDTKEGIERCIRYYAPEFGTKEAKRRHAQKIEPDKKSE